MGNQDDDPDEMFSKMVKKFAKKGMRMKNPELVGLVLEHFDSALPSIWKEQIVYQFSFGATGLLVGIVGGTILCIAVTATPAWWTSIPGAIFGGVFAAFGVIAGGAVARRKHERKVFTRHMKLSEALADLDPPDNFHEMSEEEQAEWVRDKEQHIMLILRRIMKMKVRIEEEGDAGEDEENQVVANKRAKDEEKAKREEKNEDSGNESSSDDDDEEDDDVEEKEEEMMS